MAFRLIFRRKFSSTPKDPPNPKAPPASPAPKSSQATPAPNTPPAPKTPPAPNTPPAPKTPPAPNLKVAVLGASGGVGQPLSLLLKNCPLVSKLNLYDKENTEGVATDLSQIDTPIGVEGFNGPDKLSNALQGMDLVVIAAGLPRKPGMTRDDLFTTNACIIRELMRAIAEYSPNSLIAIITNPLNSVLPIACEVLKKAGKLNANKVFGITSLDLMRARAFFAQLKNINPLEVDVPVIGGHSGKTIVPIFSQIRPCTTLSTEERCALIKKVQEGGTEVVNAKAGTGSATLSIACAAYRFIINVLRSLKGEENIVEIAYVASNVCCEVEYFSGPFLLSKCGIQRHLGLGKLDELESALIKSAIPELKNDIKKGVEFAQLP